jgi:hypothetical protein
MRSIFKQWIKLFLLFFSNNENYDMFKLLEHRPRKNLQELENLKNYK